MKAILVVAALTCFGVLLITVEALTSPADGPAEAQIEPVPYMVLSIPDDQDSDATPTIRVVCHNPTRRHVMFTLSPALQEEFAGGDLCFRPLTATSARPRSVSPNEHPGNSDLIGFNYGISLAPNSSGCYCTALPLSLFFDVSEAGSGLQRFGYEIGFSYWVFDTEGPEHQSLWGTSSGNLEFRVRSK